MGAVRPLPHRRLSAADHVREAVRRLYCEDPEEYLRYREHGSLSPEQAAWKAVDSVIRAILDRPCTIIDLGCGAGNAALKEWGFQRYIGIDISAAMIARHVLSEDRRAAFVTTDLETAPQATLASLGDSPGIVLAVLSLHYILDLKRAIQPFAMHGQGFCFVVANSYYDVPNTSEEGLVERTKGNMQLRYLSHILARYVEAIGEASEIVISQCGEDSNEVGSQPYWLIRGIW